MGIAKTKKRKRQDMMDKKLADHSLYRSFFCLQREIDTIYRYTTTADNLKSTELM